MSVSGNGSFSGRLFAGSNAHLGELTEVVNTTAPNTLVFTLPSDLKLQLDVHQRIVAQIRKAGCTERDEFCIRLALEEGLTNAMKHGNNFDPKKKVRVTSAINDGISTIVIEDEGPGFVPDAVPDPTTNENLGRPSGRGVLLIRSFMDSVSYNERGNRVTMKKTLGSLTRRVS